MDDVICFIRIAWTFAPQSPYIPNINTRNLVENVAILTNERWWSSSSTTQFDDKKKFHIATRSIKGHLNGHFLHFLRILTSYLLSIHRLVIKSFAFFSAFCRVSHSFNDKIENIHWTDRIHLTSLLFVGLTMNLMKCLSRLAKSIMLSYLLLHVSSDMSWDYQNHFRPMAALKKIRCILYRNTKVKV